MLRKRALPMGMKVYKRAGLIGVKRLFRPGRAKRHGPANTIIPSRQVRGVVTVRNRLSRQRA